ncbi:PREDICTED: LOW QUALITY PROTEIN: uncharacterized protein LOC108517735 [Rhinopithecus bieti]|uniref:LOW QUALITY PROTEIN: uncharacterized protein LOC108517735 n=1 Tax=Rhinopithecus bieti TaxID=61621 RepID=UPI00083C781F|nr:PREDICTED: LOW QUALITY PROTEIN: uncharacterized protein LOC108517735 [Rhinopithecus bieti]
MALFVTQDGCPALINSGRQNRAIISSWKGILPEKRDFRPFPPCLGAGPPEGSAKHQEVSGLLSAAFEPEVPVSLSQKSDHRSSLPSSPSLPLFETLAVACDPEDSSAANWCFGLCAVLGPASLDLGRPWPVKEAQVKAGSCCWLSSLLLEASASLRMGRTDPLTGLQSLEGSIGQGKGGHVASCCAPCHRPEEQLCPLSTGGPGEEVDRQLPPAGIWQQEPGLLCKKGRPKGEQWQKKKKKKKKILENKHPIPRWLQIMTFCKSTPGEQLTFIFLS